MKLKFIQLLAIAALTFTPACWAQSPLVGDWLGTLNAGGVQYRIAWHVTAAKDGSLSATIDNLDMGILAIPIKSMTVKDATISQVMDAEVQISGEAHAVRGTFVGTLSKDGSEVKGTWTQSEPEQPPAELVMKHTTAQAETKPAEPPQIVGDWLGILTMQGSDMHVLLHIIAAKDGTLAATADVPDQGIVGVPGSAISFKDSKLSINFDSYNGVYAGTLSPDAAAIKGTFTTDQPTELNFIRAAASSAPTAAAPTPTAPKN